MISIYFRKHGQVREKQLIAKFQWLQDAENYVDELNRRIRSGFYKDDGYFFIA